MKKRLVYIDVLKLIGIFLVIYNHTFAYSQYTICDVDSKRIWVYIYTSILTKINVPLFMMATGALLLKKDVGIRYSLNKFFKFSAIFVLATAFLFLLQNNFSFNAISYIKAFIAGSIDPSHWYMFAYLGFILFLPYIGKIAKGFTDKDFIYFSILFCIVNTFMPIFNFFFGDTVMLEIPKYMQLPLLTVKMYYYAIIGYYIANKINIEKYSAKKIVLRMLIPSLLLTIIPTYFTFKTGITRGFNQIYFECFNYFMVLSVFILVKKMMQNVNSDNKIPKIISVLGGATLGVYLFEPILKHILYMPLYDVMTKVTYNITVISVVWCLFAIIICSCITLILRKIPIIRKLF